MTNNEKLCYSAWRRSESYQIPVNELGQTMAEERYKQFKKGYYAGLNTAAYELEQLHKSDKWYHRFYLLASEHVRGLIKGETQ
jgi:hypothetical protein